jgi:hypothetical protein
MNVDMPTIGTHVGIHVHNVHVLARLRDTFMIRVRVCDRQLYASIHTCTRALFRHSLSDLQEQLERLSIVSGLFIKLARAFELLLRLVVLCNPHVFRGQPVLACTCTKKRTLNLQDADQRQVRWFEKENRTMGSRSWCT